jgi:hypothetical protein
MLIKAVQLTRLTRRTAIILGSGAVQTYDNANCTLLWHFGHVM